MAFTVAKYLRRLVIENATEVTGNINEVFKTANDTMEVLRLVGTGVAGDVAKTCEMLKNLRVLILETRDKQGKFVSDIGDVVTYGTNLSILRLSGTRWSAIKLPM